MAGITINELDALSGLPSEALLHIYHDGVDYKKTLGSVFSASNLVFVNATAVLGVAGSYTATTTPPITAYETGKIYIVFFSTLPTASVSINIDGVGSIPVKKQVNPGITVDLGAGDVTVNSPMIFTYTSGEFVLAGVAGTSLFSNDVLISSADFKNMDEAHCQYLVPALPTGYVADVVKIIFKLHWVSGNAQYISGDDIVVNSSSNGGSAQYYLPSSNYCNSVVALYNLIRNDTEPFFEGDRLRAYFPTALPTTGNSNVSFSVLYRIVKL